MIAKKSKRQKISNDTMKNFNKMLCMVMDPLVRFLNFMDVLSLSKAIPSIKNVLKKYLDINEMLKRAFSVLDINIDIIKLNEYLQQTGGFLSGSFLLWAITLEYGIEDCSIFDSIALLHPQVKLWVPNNIDIFIPCGLFYPIHSKKDYTTPDPMFPYESKYNIIESDLKQKLNIEVLNYFNYHMRFYNNYYKDNYEKTANFSNKIWDCSFTLKELKCLNDEECSFIQSKFIILQIPELEITATSFAFVLDMTLDDVHEGVAHNNYDDPWHYNVDLDKTLKITVVKNVSIIEWILNFDMTVLKNSWNGKLLKIAFPFDILKNHIRSNNGRMISKNRMEDYRNRGFKYIYF